jgi:hypothetical protein
MPGELPLVRVFVACEELEYDSGAGQVTLHKLFHRIVRSPEEPFPCMPEQLALYAMLTNGRGKHYFGLGLFFLENGMERTIKAPVTKEINLGADPTMVHGLPVPHVRAVFDRPGQYLFALLCDGRRIAEYPFEVQGSWTGIRNLAEPWSSRSTSCLS